MALLAYLCIHAPPVHRHCKTLPSHTHYDIRATSAGLYLNLSQLSQPGFRLLLIYRFIKYAHSFVHFTDTVVHFTDTIVLSAGPFVHSASPFVHFAGPVFNLACVVFRVSRGEPWDFPLAYAQLTTHVGVELDLPGRPVNSCIKIVM